MLIWFRRVIFDPLSNLSSDQQKSLCACPIFRLTFGTGFVAVNIAVVAVFGQKD